MSDCPKPGPCDPQTFTVEATSTYPPSKACWEVTLPTEQHVYYQNITYNLISLLIGAIGVAFSKHDIDGDADALKHRIAEIEAVLDADILP